MNCTDPYREFKDRFLSVTVLVACLALFAIKAVTSLMQESATWDETKFFGLGKYLLQTHRWDVPGSVLHPPMSFYIHSLPLLFFHTDPKVFVSSPAESWHLDASEALFRGRSLLESPANHGDRMLDLARLMIVLTTMLLGYYVYRWSKELYGRWSAILAIVLFSFSPNILAHARLITTESTVMTFSFITFYYLWRLLKFHQLRHAIIGGVFLGLALLSKFTSLLWLPAILALMIFWRLKFKALNILHCLIFFGVAIGVVFLVYGPDGSPYIAGIEAEDELSPGGHGLYPYFLMGHYSDTGWWFYNLVSFLIKTPLATMVFLAVSTWLLVGKIRREEWVDEIFLLLPAGVVFCFFCIFTRPIGLRFILPMYPFLFVFASNATQLLLSNKAWARAYAALMVWYIGASFYIHPHYLAYFNELVGGPNNGYKFLVDSNLDWGQDLKGLKNYMDAHGIRKISLSYFGTDLPERYGIAYKWLPSFDLEDPDPKHHDDPSSGWVAISATDLQGAYFFDKKTFARFKQHKPVAKIGYSIFIYNLDEWKK